MAAQVKLKQSHWLWFVLFICQGLVVLSAIGLVYSKHISRALFSELQSLQDERDVLNNEWTKLLLEQSVWASDGRIDKIARQDLSMDSPKPENILMVQP